MTSLPLNIDFQQIFLHMLNFIILAGGLYFLLYKPVRSFMEKRIAYYEAMDRESEDKKKEAQKTEKDYEEKLSKANAEARKIRADARAEAAAIVEKASSDAELESKRILDEAREKAAHEKETIVNSAKTEIIDLVLEAEKKLLSGEKEHAE